MKEGKLCYRQSKFLRSCISFSRSFSLCLLRVSTVSWVADLVRHKKSFTLKCWASGWRGDAWTCSLTGRAGSSCCSSLWPSSWVIATGGRECLSVLTAFSAAKNSESGQRASGTYSVKSRVWVATFWQCCSPYLLQGQKDQLVQLHLHRQVEVGKQLVQLLL